MSKPWVSTLWMTNINMWALGSHEFLEALAALFWDSPLVIYRVSPQICRSIDLVRYFCTRSNTWFGRLARRLKVFQYGSESGTDAWSRHIQACSMASSCVKYLRNPPGRLAKQAFKEHTRCLGPNSSFPLGNCWGELTFPDPNSEASWFSQPLTSLLQWCAVRNYITPPAS